MCYGCCILSFAQSSISQFVTPISKTPQVAMVVSEWGYVMLRWSLEYYHRYIHCMHCIYVFHANANGDSTIYVGERSTRLFLRLSKD